MSFTLQARAQRENVEVAPGGPSFFLLTFGKVRRFFFVKIMRAEPFCVKTKVIGYAIFEVGAVLAVLVMTSAVYSSYFRGMFGYRNGWDRLHDKVSK